MYQNEQLTISQRVKNLFLLPYRRFFNLPQQTEMISCHESDVLTPPPLGQQTKVTLLYPTDVIYT